VQLLIFKAAMDCLDRILRRQLARLQLRSGGRKSLGRRNRLTKPQVEMGIRILTRRKMRRRLNRWNEGD
jgi:hypothetical protein